MANSGRIVCPRNPAEKKWQFAKIIMHIKRFIGDD